MTQSTQNIGAGSIYPSLLENPRTTSTRYQKILLLTEFTVGGEWIAVQRLLHAYKKKTPCTIDVVYFTSAHSDKSASKKKLISKVANTLPTLSAQVSPEIDNIFAKTHTLQRHIATGHFAFLKNLWSDFFACRTLLSTLDLSSYTTIISSDYLMMLSIPRVKVKTFALPGKRSPLLPELRVRVLPVNKIFAFHGLRSTPFTTLHDWNYRQVIIKLGEIWAWTLAHTIIVPSKTAYTYVQSRLKFLPVEKSIVIVPNVVSPVFTKNYTRRQIQKFQQHYHLTGHPVFIYVGRVVQRKGIERTVRLFQEFQKQHPRSQLVLAYPTSSADAQLLKWLIARQQNETRQNELRQSGKDAMTTHRVHRRSGIVLLPNLREHELALLYHSASVLLLLSELEFAPLVLIEALSAHCICIATDCGNAKEILAPLNQKLVVDSDTEILRSLQWLQRLSFAQKKNLQKKRSLLAASLSSSEASVAKLSSML